MPRDLETKILNETIEIFVSESLRDFEDIMAHCMRLAADTFDLASIIIYIQTDKEKGTYRQFYKWNRTSGGTVPANELLNTLPDFPALEHWIASALSGENVLRRLDKMSKEEVDYANAFGIKSMALIPVFTNDELWGAVSFLDSTNSRDFDDCIDSLHSLSHLYASIAIREHNRQESDKTSKTLEQQKEMLEMLNKAAIIFGSQGEKTFEKRIEGGVRAICDMAKLDRFSIFRNFDRPDGLHMQREHPKNWNSKKKCWKCSIKPL